MHFSNSSTCKSAPKLRRFAWFNFQTCFPPQCRALFGHLNSQKWSGCAVLLAFGLPNLLRAKSSSRHTGMCKCSSLIWPTGSASADLAGLLFEPPKKRKKNRFATFLPFRAPASSFFRLFPFSDLFSCSRLFPHSSHLCFVICPHCRKFDF